MYIIVKPRFHIVLGLSESLRLYGDIGVKLTEPYPNSFRTGSWK